MEMAGLIPCSTIILAATILATDPTAATDRSIPPVRRTRVWPKLTMITNAADLVRVLMLYAVQKLPVTRCTTQPARRVTISTIPAVDFKKSTTFFILFLPPTEMPLSEHLLLWSCLHLQRIL